MKRTMILMLLLTACGSRAEMTADVLDMTSVEDAPLVDENRPEGWTAATHSNDVDPDYATVFPQDAVLEITVTISPENWQAMLDDMATLYGEFGQSTQQQQPVPKEAVTACDELDVGADCEFELNDKTISGTCASLWDGLVACKGSGQQTIDGCADKAQGDDCTFSGGGGTLPGTCLLADKLTCIPTKDIETCANATAGDACTVGPPNNPIPATCVDFSGTLACVPDSLLPTAGPGDGPPGGGPPGGGGMEGDVNPIWVPVDVSCNGLTWWHVGMRFKGNSTLKFTWQQGRYKLPFKFDFDQFEDDYPEIDDQRFYGFKRLAFANNQRDDSFLREKLAGELFLAQGIPTPQRAYVAVTLDRGDGPEYMGLYTMAEVPDDPMLEVWFGNDDGNLYKPDGMDARWPENATCDEDSFSKKTNEDDADWSDIEATITALHADSTDGEAWRTTLETRMDVDGFLRYLAVNTVIQDWDQYGNIPHNYYLYGDPDQDWRISWIPWDHNESLKESGGMMDPLPLDMSTVGTEWPLIRFLMDDSVYYARYQELVGHFVDGPFAVAGMTSRIDAIHTLIGPYVSTEETPFTVLTNPEAFETETQTIVDHISARHDDVATFLK